MPICKNCGSRIDKFNKDICPICGIKNPLDGAISDTVEITSQINIKNKIDGYKPIKKNTFLVLSIIFSFLGINFFYLKRKKTGLIFLISNIVIISTLFLIIYFTSGNNLLLSILIPILSSFLVSDLISFILFYLVFNKKDGNGNFVK